jgi:hypothetical protein
MEIANARLRLNKTGSDVPLTGLTPAEALFLHAIHQGNNGGMTFGENLENNSIKVTGEAKVTEQGKERKRTDNEELRRLSAKYGHLVTKKGESVVKSLWPGMNVQLPQTFKELNFTDITYDGNNIAPLNYTTGKAVDAPKA